MAFRRKDEKAVFDTDYAIIGSGFGGSVSACRLAQKGHRVTVLEQGRRIGPAEIEQAKQAPYRKLNWLPALKRDGYLAQHLFRHVGILGGVGVGGGSLVWAAVMLPPKPSFYANELWRTLQVDFEAELAPHLAEAKRMLGVVSNPRQTLQDQYLKQTAEQLGTQASFGSVPQAIFFGKEGTEGQVHDDPFFAGDGPQRKACQFCAGCLSGCQHGSKNSLDYNYLYLAEKAGVDIQANTQVVAITPLADGGYRLQLQHPFGGQQRQLTAAKVVLSAGVVGSLSLLFRCRDELKTLPNLSSTLGKVVRTNSEALTAVLSDNPDEDLSDGAALSTDFYMGDNSTHITQNRVDSAYGFMRWVSVPMNDGHHPWLRSLITLGLMFVRPDKLLRHLLARNWTKRVTVITTMQDDDSGIGFRWGRAWWAPWRKKLKSTAPAEGKLAPSYLPVANEVTKVFAQQSGGMPLSSISEALAGQAMTAHILGGCPIGRGAEDGVIDLNHEVFGHPGLFVVDGAAIPANLGVNPSLTITAMAERFAARQPAVV